MNRKKRIFFFFFFFLFPPRLDSFVSSNLVEFLLFLTKMLSKRVVRKEPGVVVILNKDVPSDRSLVSDPDPYSSLFNRIW